MFNQHPKPSQLTLLSLKKVADYLDVSLSTVRRLIKDGVLRARRVGGQLRVSLADLEAYVAASLQDPKT